MHGAARGGAAAGGILRSASPFSAGQAGEIVSILFFLIDTALKICYNK